MGPAQPRPIHLTNRGPGHGLEKAWPRPAACHPYQNLFNDNDMQDAFQKLREKGYRWARFIVNTSVGLKPAYKSFKHLISSNDASKDFSTPANQVSVNLNLEPSMDWFDFANQEVLAKFPARNSITHPENSVTVLENEISPSSFDDTKNVAKYLGNVVVEPNDDESDRPGDDVSNHGLDNYRSGDESGEEFNNESDEAAWARYEASSGGFEFTTDGENVILRPGQLFTDVYEFRKVIRVFAIRNGFRLKRIKNEKARVIVRCTKPGCTWRIHARELEY